MAPLDFSASSDPIDSGGALDFSAYSVPTDSPLDFSDGSDALVGQDQKTAPGLGAIVAGGLKKGFAANADAAKQAGQLYAGETPDAVDETPDETSDYTTAPFDFSSPPTRLDDLAHLGKKILGKSVYGLTESAPELGMAIAGGAAGALAGTAAAPGIGTAVGALSGTALGAGAMNAAKTLAPFFADELKRTPDDRDGAFDRALARAGTSGAFTGMGFALFEAKPFAGAVKNLALQVLGVQPAVAAAGQVAQNEETGKPLAEGVAQAAGEGAIGTVVPLVAHAAVTRLRGEGKGAAAPIAEVPEQSAEPVAATTDVSQPANDDSIDDAVQESPVLATTGDDASANTGRPRAVDEMRVFSDASEPQAAGDAVARAPAGGRSETIGDASSPEQPDLSFPLRSFGVPKEAGQPISSFGIFRGARFTMDPDYAPAKGGDDDAAVRLVQRVVDPQTVAEAHRRFGSDAIYVPVHAQEMSGRNKIPQTLARYYAEATGARAVDDIVQVNRAHHTGKTPLPRLISRPIFAGPVERGGRYVLVDDVNMLGGTLAELSHHIQEGGGKVAGIVTLANAGREAHLSPNPKLSKLIDGRFGDVIRKEFGIEPAALTASEAKYLANFRDADGLRAAIAKERYQSVGSNHPGGLSQGGGAGEIRVPASEDTGRIVPDERGDALAPDKTEEQPAPEAGFSIPASHAETVTSPIGDAADGARKQAAPQARHPIERFNVPSQTARWLGFSARITIAANFEQLRARHPEYYETVEDVRRAFDFVIAKPDGWYPHKDGRITLFREQAPGGIPSARIDFERHGDDYRIASVYTQTKRQIVNAMRWKQKILTGLGLDGSSPGSLSVAEYLAALGDRSRRPSVSSEAPHQAGDAIIGAKRSPDNPANDLRPSLEQGDDVKRGARKPP